jgi:hypothetical protein
MNPTKRLTGVCSECGGSIEFPADLVGTMSVCPRCRKQTELMLAAPPQEPAVPRKVIVWAAITIVILAVGLVVTVVGLKHFEKLAARQRDRTAAAAGARDAATSAGLEVSGISLAKGQGGNGVCVVGTVANTSPRQHSGVSVSFDLFDAGGQKVGIVSGYRPTLGPRAKWEIKVPVASDSKAVSARLASIKAAQ